MNSYASAKGKSLVPAPSSTRRAPASDDELTDADIERIAKNRDFIKKHMPELVDFIKGLHEAGMIDGWRSVRRCALLKDIEQ